MNEGLIVGILKVLVFSGPIRRNKARFPYRKGNAATDPCSAPLLKKFFW